MDRFYRVMRTIAFAILGPLFPYRVEGRENIPKNGGAVLCCNHTSASDIWLLGLSCPRQIFFMAKVQVFKNPLFGWFIRRLGAFPVDRDKSGFSAVEKAKEIVLSGKLLGIFPEGTRNHAGRPGKAKAGAMFIASQTGAAVIPAAIYHKTTGLPIFRRSVIRYGKPIPPEEIAINGVDREGIRRATESVMNRITELWEAGY